MSLAAAAAGGMSPLLDVAIVLVVAKLFGTVARRLGQPPVLGELLGGVVMGPAVLGWIQPTPLTRGLAEIGVVLLMFLAGLETNVAEVRRTAVAAFWVALLGVVLPFAGGWYAATWFGADPARAAFTGVLLVATSVSISAETLRELGWLQRPEGSAVLAAAVYDDVLGLLALTVVLATVAAPSAAGAGAAPGGGHLVVVLAEQVVSLGLFAAGAVVAGYLFVPLLIRGVARLDVPALPMAVAAACALLFAHAAEFFGLAGIIGAYLLGLMLAVRGEAHDIERDLATPAATFFTPFFFTSVGLLLPPNLTGSEVVALTAVLVVVAVVTKVVGCGAGAWLGGFRGRAALMVGAAMVARGEVGLIVAAIGRDRGIIGPELYAVTAVVAVLTTLLTPPLIAVAAGRPAESGSKG